MTPHPSLFDAVPSDAMKQNAATPVQLIIELGRAERARQLLVNNQLTPGMVQWLAEREKVAGDAMPPPIPSRHRLPVARARDPETSHLAGAKATKAVRLREAHAAVMMLFGMHGPMADHELVARARASQHPACRQSDSGLRSRRKELSDKGKLQFVRRTTTPLGNPCDVWGIPK